MSRHLITHQTSEIRVERDRLPALPRDHRASGAHPRGSAAQARLLEAAHLEALGGLEHRVEHLLALRRRDARVVSDLEIAHLR
eukprot:scaffold25591_cov72-Phaeocystis_antarctica.AAC.1